MTKSGKIILKIITLLLILLWFYTASSKLMDYNDFSVQLSRQVLPAWLKEVLLITLPEAEIVIGLLLLFKKSELAGLWVSFLLMLLFTGYVGLVVIGYFHEVPCSCGGVIKAMGWNTHFYFNLLFLLLTIVGILLKNRERRVTNKQK
jgi:putative oxidoreductase